MDSGEGGCHNSRGIPLFTEEPKMKDTGAASPWFLCALVSDVGSGFRALG